MLIAIMFLRTAAVPDSNKITHNFSCFFDIWVILCTKGWGKLLMDRDFQNTVFLVIGNLMSPITYGKRITMLWYYQYNVKIKIIILFVPPTLYLFTVLSIYQWYYFKLHIISYLRSTLSQNRSSTVSEPLRLKHIRFLQDCFVPSA